MAQRYKRVDLDRFKAELKDHVTHFLFEQTGRSPIIIPVVNIINPPSKNNRQDKSQTNEAQEIKTPEQIAAEQQKRFQEMRSRLLAQDPRTD